MNIELSELLDAIRPRSQDTNFPIPIDEAVFIRTVTYHYTGWVAEVKGGAVRLSEAAWIADSGRWSDALKTGELYEVEPYPDECWIMIHSIVDVSLWRHPLPREQS